MVWKKKPKRIHDEPEYSLKNPFNIIPVPPEEEQYKRPIRDIIIGEFKRSWNDLRYGFSSFKQKKIAKYLEPEMTSEEGRRALRFDPEKQSIKDTLNDKGTELLDKVEEASKDSGPEYQSNDGFKFMFVPQDEHQYKQPFKDKVIKEFSRAWNNFKIDFYSLKHFSSFKQKKIAKYLEPEMTSEEGRRASRFDPEKQSIKNTTKYEETELSDKIKETTKEKAKEDEEEWDIKNLSSNIENPIENLNPSLPSQQKAQVTLYKVGTSTNTHRKGTLEDKIKGEVIREISNPETNMTPIKFIKQYFENKRILKENGLIIPFSQKLKNKFKYLSPKKSEREDLIHYKSHEHVWKKTIVSLTATAALATAIFLTSDVENTQNIIPKSSQATGKIQYLQKSTPTTKTLTRTSVTKKAQVIQKDTFIYTVKKGDTFSEIVKQYVHKSGSELYADVNRIQKLNPKLMENPDLIKPNQKIVLGTKEKLVDKEYKVRLETNGRRTYLNTDGTKVSPDLQRQIILYEAKQNEAKQKLKDNALNLPKNKYSSIDNIVDNYNSAAGNSATGLFRKKDEKNKTYIANILDLARGSGKTIQATNAYVEHSKDSEAIKETIRENYLCNSKREIDKMLADKFEGLDTTKVKFTSIIDEKYGKGIIRKRSKKQKKQALFMKESEKLYLNSGQGISEPIIA